MATSESDIGTLSCVDLTKVAARMLPLNSAEEDRMDKIRAIDEEDIVRGQHPNRRAGW